MISSSAISDISYFYKDKDNHIQKFEHLEYSTYSTLSNLIKYVSPEADLNTIPSFQEFNFDNKHVRILNYTINQFAIRFQDLAVKEKNIINIDLENCFIIAYKTPLNSNLIFLEIKNDVDFVPGKRSFILQKNNYCAFFTTTNIIAEESKKLFTQIAIQNEVTNTSFVSNSYLSVLKKKI